ncbi:LuxR family transcriptional regulator [Sulfuricaulis limicola]|uniref:LuxR family transcriptional regulator n=1 Tax=Sulfuricaulis limicola TaxID=1620215 RepID=A0A1B4XH03_9GAMM|nr:response regulator transcription factor [Sulfuricaulis limicola]BAV34098.1 LuxR family transcriptional regulator [Sulfuricaulis limicola]
MAISVLLADDHAIVRQGLKALLDKEAIDVVCEAADGRQAVKMVREHKPDVAVLDLAMPLLNGLDAAREILKMHTRTRPMLLTMHTEDHYVLEALRAGVRGYVMKSHSREDLVRAIKQVAHGEVYLSPGISEVVVQAYLNKSDYSSDPLSGRERQVLQLVAEGNTTKKVASLLGLSVKTAESHRARIMEKLDIHETAGLVRYAIRRGIIQP